MQNGLRLEYVSLRTLQRQPRNPKDHDLGKIHTSIQQFGFVTPMIIDERTNRLVAGHGRLDALLQMKASGSNPPARIQVIDNEWYVPVVRGVSFESDLEAEAYTIADNQLTMVGGWDNEQLAALLSSIAAEDEKLLLATGYDGDDVDALLAELGNAALRADDPGAQIDRAEELQAKWQVQRGDVWQIGAHRLMCGDSTSAEDVALLMAGEKADFVFADPPYGINIVAANVSVGGGEAYNIPFGGKKRLGTADGSKPFGAEPIHVRGSIGATNIVKAGKYAPIAGDDSIETAIKTSGMYLEMFPNAVHVWWGGNYYANVLPPSSCWIVWNKETTGNFADCELAWTNQPTAVRMFTHRWNGMLRDSERERRWHPTQKPGALAAWVFETYGKSSDVIIDPFIGAGCSLVGAQMLNDGRAVYGLELSSEYCAVTLERLAGMGLEPVRVDS